jgi:hypothetical protein
LRKEKKGLEQMNGYMEDCKEYLEEREEAQNKIELLQLALNHKEMKALSEKKENLKESIKASTEKKLE